MKLYNPKEFQELYDYKEKLEDENIKNIISDLLRNYNIMYIKYREYLKDKEDRKGLYDQLDKKTKEIDDLRDKIERKNNLIKLLKEEGTND